MRSANTVSMTACRRWVRSASTVASVLLVKNGWWRLTQSRSRRGADVLDSDVPQIALILVTERDAEVLSDQSGVVVLSPLVEAAGQILPRLVSASRPPPEPGRRTLVSGRVRW